ncbi:MAG: flagellar hook-basal body complex protein FliE [Planctomycetia bacterium]|nr:flagellar hook-basal body complex protein FliE [Planctomycetia bacterium]
MPPVMPPGLPGAGGAEGGGFKDFLLSSIRDVNSAQQQADRAMESLFTGGDVNPAEVLTAVQKADLAFRLLMEVRNKVLQAYDEVRAIQL